MTLILTLLSRQGIYQSSDYRLTKAGEFVDERAGAKQLSINSGALQIQLCFTGVASVNGSQTQDWISEVIKRAAEPLDINDIATQIAAHGTKAIAPAREKMLTILIAFMERGQPRLVLISNTDRFDGPRRDGPLDHLEVSSLAPRRPLLRSYGIDIAVSRNDRRFLKSLLRANSDPKIIMNALAVMNSRASQDPKSRGAISKECMVSSLLPDGRRSEMNFGETKGIPKSFVDGFDVGAFVRNHFEAVSGKEIIFRQSTGIVAGPATATSRPTTGLSPIVKQPSPIIPARAQKKIGRNEVCPCGSGKKYKKCHGRVNQA